MPLSDHPNDNVVAAAVSASPSRSMLPHKRKMNEREREEVPKKPWREFEWENSKENVMPLKRGRNVEQLNKALRLQESFDAKTRLEAEAKQMEEQVKQYQGDDPLVPWAQYIRWIETNMPEDTRKKFGALERATRELKDRKQYKDDIRYIRMWIQYADLVSNPKDIFKFLYQNKIGEHISLFYVGWAWVLESMANYAQAHKVYLKAAQKYVTDVGDDDSATIQNGSDGQLTRKAQPAELLDRKYKEFQRRMSRHWMKVQNSMVEGADDGDCRQALGDISADATELQRVTNSEHFRRYAQEQAQRTQQANSHKPVFQIYEDPAGTEHDFTDENADWRYLNTVRHQNKENDTAPVRWNDAPLQATVTETPRPPPPSEPIQVFVDEQFSEVDSRAPSVARDSSLTLRQRLDGSATEEEQLAKMPLKNFSAKIEDDHPKPPRKTKRSDKNAMIEKSSYNFKMIQSTDGELCFEEVRARRYQLHKVREYRGVRTSNSFLAEPMSQVAATANTATYPTNGSESARFEALPHQQIQSNALSTLDAAAQEDMTITTRLAMEEVNNMFCSPSRESTAPAAVAKKWDGPEEEPVERKLHFSIFEDSMDTSINGCHDPSGPPESQASKAFEVFTDCAESVVQAPRTITKSARKPLGSRDDLVRRTKLTNKDAIMMAQKHQEDDSKQR